MEKAKLRIAIVSTETGWYGGEQQACLLASGLIDAGHECLVVAPAGFPFATGMAERGFETLPLGGAAHSLAALRQLRRRLSAERVDLVHGNDSGALTATGLALLGRRAPARVASRRVDFVPRSPWAYRAFAHRIVCVSEAARQRCAQAGVPPAMLHVVHDGVDAERIDAGVRERGRRALELGDVTPVVLAVAALHECKGHRHLLEAFSIVHTELPMTQLVLAGDGGERERLQGFAATLDITDHVHWLGYRSDVPDLIHACDLMVLPSTQEGLGSSLIDGMLASRPIVASATGGIPELLGPDDDGNPMARLVASGDPQALAGAMLAALRSDPEDGGRCRRAQARAREQFLAANMVSNTLEVYRQVLRKATPGSYNE